MQLTKVVEVGMNREKINTPCLLWGREIIQDILHESEWYDAKPTIKTN